MAVLDNCACGDVGTPFHYAPTCTLSFHFKTPSTIRKLPWLRNLVANPHSRRRLKILMDLIQTNEQLLDAETPFYHHHPNIKSKRTLDIYG
ncbi:hypothetical protein AVEN_185410-1 [Araneus ventricosus]|uniref:Uncharacterized protein n=1 Tax=Araneus ventricosus TaxID=182803 RepID=A0A4Y2CKU7_ARAVE|nr:hypothetical protein AVEN_185410-1 [Araneus ventricosus]